MDQRVEAALKAVERGENVLAENLLHQALDAHPNDAEAWLLLADLQAAAHRKREYLERALVADPHNGPARQRLHELDAESAREAELRGEAAARSAALFNGQRIRRGLLPQLFAYLVGLLLIGGAAWLYFFFPAARPANAWLAALGIAGLGLYILGVTLTSVQEIAFEPERIVIFTNLSEKAYRHSDISVIDLGEYRQRRKRRAVQKVRIVTRDRRTLMIDGLEGGTERLYAALCHWWRGPDSQPVVRAVTQ